MSSTATAYATVESNGSGKAGSLTPGIVTPEVLLAWEHSCHHYFAIKETDEAQQVGKVIYELRDPRIRSWAMTNRVRLQALTFDDFLIKFRDEWLEMGWEKKMKLRILGMRQGSTPFRDWAIEIQSLNAILTGLPSHLSSDAIRDHLTVNMTRNLVEHFDSLYPTDITVFAEWITALSRLDETLTHEQCRLVAAAQAAAQTAVRQERTQRNTTTATQRTAAAGGTSTSGGTRTKCPSLLESEKALLRANSGCFKC